MKKNKKVLMVVGGTGGHIYPGLSLTSELKKRRKDINISFFTDKRMLAKNILGRLNYRVYRVTSFPFPRKKFWHICCFISKTLIGFLESFILLKKRKPDLIIAFGAYISVPVVLAGAVMKIPVILHEQNYFPGMANRFLAFCASSIAVTFKASGEYFPPGKTVLTGNPVREEIVNSSRQKGLERLKLSTDRMTILVFGGSQGAKDINISFPGVLPYLEGLKNKLQFIHISGERDFMEVSNKYKKAKIKARVFKYLQKMHYAYSAADIVVCRAGATTVAEISSRGIPAVFIPYPYATSSHQALNAKAICERGGGVRLPDKDISPEAIALKLVPLIKDSGKRRSMEIGSKALRERFIKAAARLADLVENYV